MRKLKGGAGLYSVTCRRCNSYKGDVTLVMRKPQYYGLDIPGSSISASFRRCHTEEGGEGLARGGAPGGGGTQYVLAMS